MGTEHDALYHCLFIFERKIKMTGIMVLEIGDFSLHPQSGQNNVPGYQVLDVFIDFGYG
jgi:hypothetical protein